LSAFFHCLGAHEGVERARGADEQEEKRDLAERVSRRRGREADVENDEAHRSNPSGRAIFLFIQQMVAGPPRDASRSTAHLVAPGVRIFLRSLPKPIPVVRGSSRGYSDRNRLPDVQVAGVVL